MLVMLYISISSHRRCEHLDGSRIVWIIPGIARGSPNQLQDDLVSRDSIVPQGKMTHLHSCLGNIGFIFFLHGFYDDSHMLHISYRAYSIYFQ